MRLLIFVLLLQIIAISCSQAAFDLSRCQRIPAVETGELVRLMDIGELTGIRNIMAVKSADTDLWFVAMDLEGPGLDSNTDIAIWATEVIEPFLGPFSPVDELALRYSGDSAIIPEPPFPPETDGIAESARCSRYIGVQ